jgi:hypothetical protein
LNSGTKLHFQKSDEPAPTLYFSFMPQYAAKMKETEKGMIFFGSTFVFGLIGNKECADLVKELETACKGMSSKAKCN